jgi:hemerythrin-like domain-containing protein
MRSPAEIWIREHREAFEHADRLAELLAPSDIHARMVDPSQNGLRAVLVNHLEQLIEFSESHFRLEERLLIPAITQYLDNAAPEIREALGCFAREHAQMHRFANELNKLLPSLHSDTPPDRASILEILNHAFAVQSLIRYHCTNEERNFYPLIDKLPQSVCANILGELDVKGDIAMEHLIKPMDAKSGVNIFRGEDSEGPEN